MPQPLTPLKLAMYQPPKVQLLPFMLPRDQLGPSPVGSILRVVKIAASQASTL